MIRLGLIGYPLGHSLSPKLHQAALEACGLTGEYLLYPVEPEDRDGLAALLERVRSGELDGLNVTIPHKENVIPLADELTSSAQAIGAVNTILQKDEKLVGHNTDAPGFAGDLAKLLGTVPVHKKALVFGSGGGARAVVYALMEAGWQVTVAALMIDQAKALADSFGRAALPGSVACRPNDGAAVASSLEGVGLIVNASPVGMSPNVAASPWPEGLPFPGGAAVYDLVYNPRETRFVRQARRAGLRAATGLGMLVEQAALSFECWTGRIPPREVMFAAVEAGC